jgi:hypothetical protein
VSVHIGDAHDRTRHDGFHPLHADDTNWAPDGEGRAPDVSGCDQLPPTFAIRSDRNLTAESRRVPTLALRPLALAQHNVFSENALAAKKIGFGAAAHQTRGTLLNQFALARESLFDRRFAHVSRLNRFPKRLRDIFKSCKISQLARES